MHTLRTRLQIFSQRPIFRELSWYFFAQIAVQAASFISVIVVARYLGPSNLGLYSFVQNYVGVFLAIIGSMDFYFTWKIAKSDKPYEDLKEFLGHKLNVYILLSLVGIILGWNILPRDVAFMVTIMLVPIFVQALNIFSLYAAATNKAKLISVTQMATASASLILKIFLVYLQAPLYWFIAVSSIDLISSGIVMAAVFLKVPEWRNSFRTFMFPSFIASIFFLYSIRASVAAVFFWQLLLRVDQLVLALFSNAHTLGVYSAAVKIAEVPNFLAGVLSTALISRMAHMSQAGTLESKQRIKKVMLTYLGVGGAIAVFVILTAPLLVRILYGEAFLDAVSVLRIYVLSVPAMFMNYFFISMYGSRDRYRYQAVLFGCAVVANIALVLILTPVYGLMGTAAATAGAYTVATIGFYVNSFKKK